jgi:hypothetical protein
MKLKLALLTVLSILPKFMSYKIPSLDTVTPKILNINHAIHEKYNVLGTSKYYFEPNVFSIIDNYYYKEHHETMGRTSVKFVSSLLPKLDSIGGNILHANNELIDILLNNPHIPHEIQKEIILKFIKFAQYGDEFGSFLLQQYYEFVSHNL